MKFLILFISLVSFFSCNNSENKESNIDKDNSISVSFETGQNNLSEGIIVAYTNDTDSLWLNEGWIKTIKNKMKNLSSTYSTVLLFNNEVNMPNVATIGMNYSSDYDKNMVCGYWVYPNGSEKFCYGGIKSDGNFKKCE